MIIEYRGKTYRATQLNKLTLAAEVKEGKTNA